MTNQLMDFHYNMDFDIGPVLGWSCGVFLTLQCQCHRMGRFSPTHEQEGRDGEEGEEER